MATVIFIYIGVPTKIQCLKEDKMELICNKFATKIGININTFQFLYGGNKINFELTFEEQANSIDKNRNEMSILAFERTTKIIKTNEPILLSKEIICPKCGEMCRIRINNYKISLYECKNKHEINNILLSEYDNTQNINESVITCNNCKVVNKIHENRFYKCLNCKINICQSCNLIHDQQHTIIDYKNINYVCNIHNDSFISYCNKCKINLCILCEENHREHNIILYRDIFPNINKIKEELNKFKTIIDNFKDNVNEIILILTEVNNNIEKYFQINYNIINNFKIQNKNYEAIQNINEIKENMKNNNIYEIINDTNIENKFKKILNIYTQMKIREEISCNLGDKKNNNYSMNENKNKIEEDIDKFKITII